MRHNLLITVGFIALVLLFGQLYGHALADLTGALATFMHR